MSLYSLKICCQIHALVMLFPSGSQFLTSHQVLKGINFKITAGQSVGLVGPSGGGKSTVMSLLQRFYDPQEGQVYIGASKRPLQSLNIRWWRKQIGFVGQETKKTPMICHDLPVF